MDEIMRCSCIQNEDREIIGVCPAHAAWHRNLTNQQNAERFPDALSVQAALSQYGEKVFMDWLMPVVAVEQARFSAPVAHLDDISNDALAILLHMINSVRFLNGKDGMDEPRPDRRHNVALADATELGNPAID